LLAYLVQIRPDDSLNLRKKVAHVITIVDAELGFASTTKAKNEATQPLNRRHGVKDTWYTTYLYIAHKRVIGMVTTEIIRKAYPALLEERTGIDLNGKEAPDQPQSQLRSIFEHSEIPVKATLGIYRLWVHAKHRKQGIATQLIDTARRSAVFGHVVPHNHVAFSSPTVGGVYFAIRYGLNEQTGGETLQQAKVLVYNSSH
jgi:GNAT superfamily N-acetyltransferase